MRLHRHIGRFAAGYLACGIVCCLLVQAGRSQTELLSTLPETDPLLEQLLLEWHAQQRALEQLRAQQEALLQAIDLSRKELATSLSRGMDSTFARLDTLNEVLAAQRAHDLEFIRHSNRRVLTVLACLTGLLFLAMLWVTVISTRAMNRLTAALSATPFAHLPLNAPTPPALLTQSGAAQLQNAIERLERRIAELENHPGPSPQQENQGAKVQAA